MVLIKCVAPGFEVINHFEISELEGVNLDVLQGEITWKLGERQKQMEGYLHSWGISLDKKATRERVEKIMRLDIDSTLWKKR